MKAVKFISNDSDQKEFGMEVRKNINKYFKEKGISKKVNIKMFAKAIIMLSIYIVSFVFILTTPMNIWLVVLLVILMGVGEAGIGMSVMHDATHGAFSSKQRVNNLFCFYL